MKTDLGTLGKLTSYWKPVLAKSCSSTPPRWPSTAARAITGPCGRVPPIRSSPWARCPSAAGNVASSPTGRSSIEASSPVGCSPMIGPCRRRLKTLCPGPSSSMRLNSQPDELETGEPHDRHPRLRGSSTATLSFNVDEISRDRISCDAAALPRILRIHRFRWHRRRAFRARPLRRSPARTPDSSDH